MNAILPILKLVATVIATAAGGIIAMSQGGVAVPPWLIAACTAIVSIAAGLGIASNGIQGKVETKAEAVDTLNKVQ